MQKSTCTEILYLLVPLEYKVAKSYNMFFFVIIEPAVNI